MSPAPKSISRPFRWDRLHLSKWICPNCPSGLGSSFLVDPNSCCVKAQNPFRNGRWAQAFSWVGPKGRKLIILVGRSQLAHLRSDRGSEPHVTGPHHRMHWSTRPGQNKQEKPRTGHLHHHLRLPPSSLPRRPRGEQR